VNIDVPRRFGELYRGNERAHGGWKRKNAKPDANGKVEGSHFTKKGPVTTKDILSHFSGNTGLGACSVRDDGTVGWGAIDDDDCDLGRNDNAGLKALEAKVRDLGLPLIVSRTKSGAAHLDVFLKSPAPARIVRRLLKKWATLLDLKSIDKKTGKPIPCEIFPKQNALVDGINGNWINLPYFGNGSTDRFVVHEGKQLSIEQFLDLAESMRLSPEEVAAFLADDNDDDDTADDDGKFKRAAALNGAGNHNRNNTLFPLACSEQGLAHPIDVAREVLRKAGAKCDPPVSAAECDKFVERAYQKYPTPDRHPYIFENRDGALWAAKKKKDPADLKYVQLTNIELRMVEDRTRDDGAGGLERMIGIEGRDGINPTKTVYMTVPDYNQTDWPKEKFGAQCTIFTGHKGLVLNDAIPLVSQGIKKVHVFVCPGWATVNGSPIFLHAGTSPEVATVEMENELSLVRFPEPALTGPELWSAVKASAGMLKVGPPEIMFPLFAAAYRAPLSIPPRVTLVVVGESQAGKTQIAALTMQHDGAGFDDQHLPGNFISTANSSEMLAWQLKDCVGVFDDLDPDGTPLERARKKSMGAGLIRGAANQIGRQRLTKDIRRRAAMPPRCFPIITAEENTFLQSATKRAIFIRVKKGDINPAALRKAQQDAAAGLYAAAKGGFTAWLASRLPSVQAKARAFFDEARREASETATVLSRSPDQIADLLIGIVTFADFATDIGAFTPDEATQLIADAKAALSATEKAQHAPQHDADPVLNALSLLRSAIASGKAHLAEVEGGTPLGFQQACGWRDDSMGWKPQGIRAGWVTIECESKKAVPHLGAVYLEAKAAYKAAESMESEGLHIGIGSGELASRLGEHGLLVKHEYKTRKTYAIRKTVQGQNNIPILWIAPETLFEDGLHWVDPEGNF
jgi:hypothetical protein